MFHFVSRRFKPYISQFFAVFTATLGVLGNGMEYGWPSPAIPVLLDSSTSPVPLWLATDGPFWLETLYVLGGVCALPITCVCADRLGRRRSILLAGATGTVTWILTATASTVTQLYIARFLGGMGANMQFVCIPMYTAEAAQPQIRGFLGTLIQVMTLIGVLIGYSVIPHVPIWTSSCVGLAIPILQIITFYWQPESPYYLLVKNQETAAHRALSRLRAPHQDVTQELQDIQTAVTRQCSEKGRIMDLVLIPSNRKASVIMAVLNTGQHLTGSSVVIMNVQTIVAQGGEGLVPPEMIAVMFGVAMLVSAMIGSLLIDRFGRKILLLSSYLLTSFFLAILSLYLYYLPPNQPWLPLIATLGFALSFKYGLGLVPIVATAEMFPSSLKSIGMVVSDLWFTVMAMVSLRIYYSTSEIWGTYVPFGLFAVCGILTAAFLQYYMPETKGKTLEEIQMILKGKEAAEDKIDEGNTSVKKF